LGGVVIRGPDFLGVQIRRHGRALVTGHRGFVGRHMARALERRGYDVFGVDIAEGHDAVAFFELDGRQFDLVVHCAAVVGGRTMIEGDPLTLAVHDLALDAALFRWALRNRPGRIVYFSSSAAYPTCLQRERCHAKQLAESHIDHHAEHIGTPDETYGWVKLTGERLAAEANAVGIPTYVFRPFSGYGADQALDYPFPAIVERARRRESPLSVWANTVRDFIHVDDIVNGVMAALDQGHRGPVNLCTGVATSFVDLATMAARHVGYDPEVVVLNEQMQRADGAKMPTGVAYRVGCPKAMSEFYAPRVTIADGIARALGRVAA
jgi:nucleoside-diphosphate-sugar epimerase